MTTTVIVRANHGWPVEVTQINPATMEPIAPKQRVEPNTERSFCVHSTADLHVHEVQPHEQARDLDAA